MRARNERLVLTLIRRHGPLAKSEITRRTGLSAQSVSVIMRALEAEGLLTRGTPQRGRVGQPSVPMALAPGGALFYGLRIGRRAVEMVLIDFLGTCLARRIEQHEAPDIDRVLRFAQTAVAEMSAARPLAERARIAGLGIALPDRIWDWPEAAGDARAALQGWAVRDIAAELGAALPFPVMAQNDANAACSADLTFGATGGARDFLHVHMGFYIGGGIVLDGRLFAGARGLAGALGSLPVRDVSGRMRQLIDLASLSGLETALNAGGYDGGALWAPPDGWDLPAPIMETWLNRAAPAIAQAVQAAVAVLDVPLVVLDGWMPATLRRALTERVRAALAVPDPDGLRRGLMLPELREGTIGPQARALGAASGPLRARFMTD
ncbi:ROK family transcriptional regulator [Rhodobacter sp. NTK016B]|uniref:ROK family transcriptional regulator n=1 Tax=Rhodobacter sp. NTK016B TaxID=2759676 RepID=UPI001A8CB6F0|nr:ROK family transcriptional regulator [Rhodobacter sp. NTK016B]MBN8294348.1 ROK family transcriptional regulator [Rhodobacter sp. NTK016B]